MYTVMKSIFADKNKQEALFFDGPGKDLEVKETEMLSERRKKQRVLFFSLSSPPPLATSPALHMPENSFYPVSLSVVQEAVSPKMAAHTSGFVKAAMFDWR